MIFKSKIAGIPCQIKVTYFHKQKPFKGPARLCDSNDDYYGYTEIEFEVLDRRGRKAEWLERKLTAEDRERIEREIEKEVETERLDYVYDV